MTVHDFVAKWRKATLKERSAAQEHFIDLCNLFEHPTPAAIDPEGTHFCFEKGAAKHGGGDGFADVWKRGFFGIEYKGKHKDLDAAYNQLLRYRDALENPPLLVLCDMDRIIIHTNFTGTVSDTHEIPLEQLDQPRNLEIMRAMFHHPDALRPGRTSVAVTQDAAGRMAEIADSLRRRGMDATTVAHFLDRIVFCLFAEDVDLLPDMIFTKIAAKAGDDPDRFKKMLEQLFDAMATGGDFGFEHIRHFNGNLFDDTTALDLTADEVRLIATAAALDWSAVDPSIFGTLFERGLDPAKRSQLGAHFTSREDIELVVDAVIMNVLRREWDQTRETIDCLLTTGKKKHPKTPPKRPPSAAAMRKARGEAASILHRFLVRLQHVRILDPSCGSGNFLYVALLRLKDLEKEVILFGGDHHIGAFLPMVSPAQLYGIELNPYAHDLAQMTVWIGWLQWIRSNGFGFPADPVLRPLAENIRLMDAILTPGSAGVSPASSETAKMAPPPTEPEWPTVDFIIGNPPFLGGKLLRRELGDATVDRMHKRYSKQVPAEADLCCYWFEKARAHIAAGKCKRAGLLATQGIRGGANREVLKRIKESGDIFWAESDRPWILDGANVHVSMVAFDSGDEKSRTLDGKTVETINANLTGTADLTLAVKCSNNAHIAFMGTTKQGAFDVTEATAQNWLSDPNPHGKPNSDILFPWRNGQDITRRSANKWIIDNYLLAHDDAAHYAGPFLYISEHVKSFRDANPRKWYRDEWWQLYAQRPEMRNALAPFFRYLVTARVAKYRLFSWLSKPVVPDCQLIVFARSDDLFFGVMHSRIHEVWALRMGTRLETRPRYTPSTCFETFPFPGGAGVPPALNAGEDAGGTPAPPGFDAIADAAKKLNALRENWLNPPEWTREEVLTFPGTVGGPWHRYIDPDTIEERGTFKIGTVRYPRLVARDEECAAKLKKRTLTNLYNERPAWLAACHDKLDAAVAAAYDWPADLSDEAILERLLALNQAEAGDA